MKPEREFIMREKRRWYTQGIRDGLPIGLGYLAVSFSFGLMAAKYLTVGEAVMMSALNLTSAGQFSGLRLIITGGGYLEMVLSQLIINLRYCLMSFTLSQKVAPGLPSAHRMAMAFGNTDEVFALAAARDAPLSPFYVYGMMSMAIPGWVLGTLLGAAAGSILPPSALSALGIALYAMFCAIVIPPASRSEPLLLLIILAMAASLLMSAAPFLARISEGMRVILLTVVLSALAAWLRPIGEERS